MKKFHTRKGYLLFLMVFFIVIIGTRVVLGAGQREYYISNYSIEVSINSDGSADIGEFITYSFKGSFNGVTMDIDLSGTKGMTNYKVLVDRKGEVSECINDNSQQPGTYMASVDASMAKFKVFEPSYNEKKTFIYKYKLIDPVVKYRDIAEFNRKLVGAKWETRLDNIYIRITLPDGAKREEVKVFAHGPLTGVSRIVDNRTIEFTVPGIPPGSFAETRVLFPNRIVPDSRNVVDKEQLKNILETEVGLAEKANEERENARRQVEKENTLKMVGNIITMVLLSLWFIISLIIYRKYDKELKSKFSGKYYRELPGNYTPSEMSVLMNSGNINPRDIMATIMDLARKGYFHIRPVKISKKGIFSTKEKDDYMISIAQDASMSDLKSHELFLAEWFIQKIGDGHGVMLDEIKEYARDKKNALEFKDDYDTWVSEVVASAEENNFFDSSVRKGKLIGALLGIFYFISGFLIILFFKSFPALVLNFQGIILLVYSFAIKRRTPYGNDQYMMWKAFKRFLLDFSNMKHAAVQSIVIWEHYLVYAVSLGVAKEVIKQLPIVFGEEQLNDPGLTFMGGMLLRQGYRQYDSFSRMFDSTIHTIEGAVVSARNIADSARSSGSGSGGGFSGGSSGGGGGGSGGGAF